MRFIPTHVGNTVWLGFSAVIVTVHPHACGEHVLSSDFRHLVGGSSPRMWGTRDFADRIAEFYRFIPTHVGNTLQVPVGAAQRLVHPHACGEHQFSADKRRLPSGSSPRMWGTPRRQWSSARSSRFIPTHVGNTFSARSMAPMVPGSSPRMWGTHLPYRIVFKEEKTPRKIYRLILYSVVRSRGWNATNCSPSNNTGCRRLTPRVWNS